MKYLRVILADDHTLVRAGIRSLLNAMKGIEVVAEASDGREALKLIGQHQPDIVLTDIAMPGLNGLETLSRIRVDHPQVRVVILSMHLNEEYVVQALRAGAYGYLLKDSATNDLEQALQTVARGETYLSPEVSKRIVDDYNLRLEGMTSSLDMLSSRQREILQLIAEGKNTKEIAELLDLSAKTVETHRAQLMDRLKIFDIPGLVRYAIRMKLVDPER